MGGWVAAGGVRGEHWASICNSVLSLEEKFDWLGQDQESCESANSSGHEERLVA